MVREMIESFPAIGEEQVHILMDSWYTSKNWLIPGVMIKSHHFLEVAVCRLDFLADIIVFQDGHDIQADIR
ncbi:hypothetical protein [Bacillus sp. FJAT-27445]|uniref:hypothetical protein n=1 Tax=Bacillus sp. FJAT-27445 TaxID=1679166 RepID=UPI0007433E22|nr:hypothetical protein [Bacillus sp. FJAT-27445]